MRTLRILPVASALSLFFAITFSISAFLEIVFKWAYSQFWSIILMGYDQLTLGTYFLGLLQMVLYGIYVSLVFVPIYNYFRKGEEELPALH